MTYPKNSDDDELNGGQLRSLVQRIENLDEEEKAIKDDKREVYAEAKANGYDPKIIRKVIAIRRRDQNEVAEEEAITDLYLQAIGRDRDAAPNSSPGASRAPASPADARASRAKDRTSEAMADNKELSAEMLRDGLITPEQHAENVALADGVAKKYGSGVTSAELKAAKQFNDGIEKSGATVKVTVQAQKGSVMERAGNALAEAGVEVERQPAPLVGTFDPDDDPEDPFGKV